MGLEVISFNIQNGRKYRGVRDYLGDQNPDIFCLQEFPGSRADNFLPGYKTTFVRSFSKGGEDYGELTGHGHGLELISAYGIRLAAINKPEQSLGVSGFRTALMTNLETPIGTLTLANLHLEWLTHSGNKLNQVGRVLEAMAGDNRTGMRVLTGDFNYSNIFQGPGLGGYLKGAGFKVGPGFKTHRIMGVSHQVDYVAYENCQLGDVRAEDTGLSDHFALRYAIQNA